MQDNCSHYARTPGVKAPLRFDSAKKLLGVIDRQFGTLPWCKRYLDRIGEKNYAVGVRPPSRLCLSLAPRRAH